MTVFAPLTFYAAMFLWIISKPAEYWQRVAGRHFAKAAEQGQRIIDSKRETERRIAEIKA